MKNAREVLAGIMDRDLDVEGLYQWSASFGRMGDLSGIVITTPKELKIRAGADVYFGEVLGKHSNVWYEFDPSDFRLITNKPHEMDALKQLPNLLSGYDPIEALGLRCPLCKKWDRYWEDWQLGMCDDCISARPSDEE
jgi:hypothetical protein